jgi:DNA-binding XRE family transcriptional regulator
MTSTDYKAIREKLGLTQAALAEKLGVTKRTIISRENGGTITHEAAIAIRSLSGPRNTSSQPLR